MPRIRQIKPEFFLDDELAQCSRDARLLFIGLWPLADREGRLENRPAKIKAQVFPYDADMSFQKVTSLLQQLTDSRFIVCYSVNSHNYIQIRTFSKHQHCHMKEPESTIPEAPKELDLSGSSTVQAPEYGASTVQEPDKPVGFLSIGNDENVGNGVLVPGKPGGPRKRGHGRTACPPDFSITSQMREWAEKNAPAVDIDKETEAFLDYHGSKGNVFKDWNLAWNNWMRNAQKFNGNVRKFNFQSSPQLGYRPDTIGSHPDDSPTDQAWVEQVARAHEEGQKRWESLTNPIGLSGKEKP